MVFHERLMQLRRERGWSQEQLAEQLGVTRQTVSKWELGSTTPEMQKLMDMSELFGISIDALVGNEAFSQPQPRTETVQEDVPKSDKWHYEYRSARTLFGLPLVHINIGLFRIYRAKGILAIGNLALGLVSLGAMSAGLISIGALAAGLLAVGALAAGGFALGAIAAGILAVGGVALGVVAFGGVAAGAYAIGGAAFGACVAAGDFAWGRIAIGNHVSGEIALSHVGWEFAESHILTCYPHTPEWLLALLRAVVQSF